MVDEGNNLYSYKLPKGYESATVIFNNDGKGKQTVNLPTKVGSTMEFVSNGVDAEGKLTGELVSKSKIYFKNTNGWKIVKVHYWPEGGSGTAWPGESMVDEGDNLYSYTLPDGFETVNVIFNNNNKGEQTDTVKSEDGKTLIYADGDWRDFTADDIPELGTGTDPGDNQEVGSKIYVKVPTGWVGIPNIHYWNTAGKTTAWPGNSMKDEGNGLYSYGIPKSFGDVKMIINDGSNKLANIEEKTEFDIKLGSSIIFEDGGWKDYVKQTNTPEEPHQQETSKTPTVSGSIYNTTTTVTGTAGANADIILSVDEVTTTTTSAGAKLEIISKFEEKEIGSTTADKDGNWAVKIPAQIRGTVILSFAYKGILPGTATIKASVDSKYNNKIMNMYSYNLENNRLTLVSPSVVIKDGIATFEITKGSDYILSETAIQGAVKEGWNQNSNGNWIFVKEENNTTGWIKDGTWYYLNESGAMLLNTSVSGYKLGTNGAWIQ